MTRDPHVPAGLLCDMDDTILDLSGARDECLRQVCAEAVGRIEGLEAHAFVAAFDRRANWYWSDPERHRQGRMGLRAAFREITHGALVELGVDRPELAQVLADRYRRLREEHSRVFPGALETLERLKARGVRLALVTNGSAQDQRRKIERFRLAPYFDGIFIEGELGVGKPHHQVYDRALEALACGPAEAWSIGDNLEWDVLGPQRLGVFGIWVDVRGQGLPPRAPARPDRIVRSITELP